VALPTRICILGYRPSNPERRSEFSDGFAGGREPAQLLLAVGGEFVRLRDFGWLGGFRAICQEGRSDHVGGATGKNG